MAPPLARGAGRRPVLAPRIAAAAVRADHVPDDDRRRLGGRLHEHRAAGVLGPALPVPRDHRPVGAHVDRDRDTRPAHRPRPRAHPLVRPLAARRAERDRRRAADRSVHAAIHPTRARPRGDARRVARRADVARRAAHSDGLAPGGRGRRSHHRARGRRHGGVDLLRGQAAVDAPRGSARGRRAVADVRLAARGGAGDPGLPTRPAHGHVAAPRGVSLRTSLRRLPRRHVRAREPRRPQPHPP